MNKVAAIILAAGEGRRMRSAIPKVCYPVAGLPMITFPVAVCHRLKASPIVLVMPARAEPARLIRESLVSLNGTPLRYVVQKKPLGTGDAVRAAHAALKSFDGTVLVLCGDAPLVQEQTVRALLEEHRRQQATVSLVSMRLAEPRGYGRILRDASGHFFRIVEERDARPSERAIQEVNSGLYAIESAFLFEALAQINRKNAQGEYYLTDLPRLARSAGKPVLVHVAERAEELLGVNTPEELARVSAVARRQRLSDLQASGVEIVDPERTYVDATVRVEAGAVILPGCQITGETTIGAKSRIGPYAVIHRSKIGREAVVKAFCVMEEAMLAAKASVGPFSHLRPGSVLKEQARVGNFVEIKKTTLGRNAKANHLTYLGDATVGEGANVGAGVITCNYDGFAKFETHIGANAFIGSDTQLVAPVRIGKGAVVGAGTTVTRDVPAGALALSRPPQEHKAGWAERRRKVLRKRKKRS